MTSTQTLNVLEALGATPAKALTPEQLARLDADGYLNLGRLLDDEALDVLRTRTDELQRLEGGAAGIEAGQQVGATMVADLFNKGAMFLPLFTQPQVLAAAAHVVGELRVNSLNMRSALPGQGNQALHPDWPSAVKDGDFHICNSMWMLDDFTEANGATRVVPGSHRWERMPSDDLEDLLAPHPDQVLVEAPAGTVVIFNSHLWHGGTLNSTDQPRRGLTLSYVRRDEPQQTDQREHIRKLVWDRLSPEERYLLDV